jgi:hypothetical protein
MYNIVDFGLLKIPKLTIDQVGKCAEWDLFYEKSWLNK